VKARLGNSFVITGAQVPNPRNYPLKLRGKLQINALPCIKCQHQNIVQNIALAQTHPSSSLHGRGQQFRPTAYSRAVFAGSPILSCSFKRHSACHQISHWIKVSDEAHKWSSIIPLFKSNPSLALFLALLLILLFYVTQPAPESSWSTNSAVWRDRE
jgi:hypothetical protein